ncbi:MAG: toll/interleukin-1 receptor domain-containing protein [Bacteroidales bacterium]|nr:toll/interleukin-1 receptor domain-containing protein [Candidatus Equimonas faecalis]
MIKVFLSHSWDQKDFVLKVAQYLGRDIAIVDNYEFESGRKIEEEIEKSINSTNVFVYLASKGSIESDWCKRELTMARDLVDEKKLIFCAFLVDNTITVGDCKPWIKQWLTTYYSNPILLARVVRRTVNELVAKTTPEVMARDLVFKGRNTEMGEIDKLLYSSSQNFAKALIISGMPHVGRKRLLREVMVNDIQHELHPTYLPIGITLQDKDSVEDLIFQLNQLLLKYSNEDLKTMMTDGANCPSLAVELLNDILNAHERVLIDDNRCIVNPNGYLADWFIDIVNHPKLPPMVSMFVASTISPHPSEVRRNQLLRATQLNALNLQNMQILFNAYSQKVKVECDSNKASDYLSELTGYPEQVLDLVDVIHDYDQVTAERELPSIKKMFDKDIKQIVDEFSKSSNAIQLLILISRFEFVSFDLLRQLYPEDDIEDLLQQFRQQSLYESFGTFNQYMRLNSSLADYLDRYHFHLAPKYEKLLEDKSKEIINTNEDEDLAVYLYKLKQQLKDPRFKIGSSYILPSLALKVIVEQYSAKRYKDVVELANKVLYDNPRNNYETVKYAIRNWLCLAYCRLGDETLFNEVQNFHGYTYHFLIGYFYRRQGNWPYALDSYNKALEAESPAKAKIYSKAKHEKVIVLMKMNDYHTAFDLAKINYESDPTNTYHIEAYYHCLVRKPFADKSLLDDLYSQMMKSYDPNKELICATFRAERSYFIDKDTPKALDILEEALLKSNGNFRNYAVEVLFNICKKQGLVESRYKEILKKCNGLSIDNKFVNE